MKKILESELLTIAHNILKLKGKEDVDKMYFEAQKLYEKLSILRFYEKNNHLIQEDYPIESLEKDLINNNIFINTIENDNETPPDVLFTPTFELNETVNNVQEIEPINNENVLNENVENEKTIKNEVIEVQKNDELDIIFNQNIENNIFNEEEKPEILTQNDNLEIIETQDSDRIIKTNDKKQIKIEEYLLESFDEPEFVIKNKLSENKNTSSLVENNEIKDEIINPNINNETRISIDFNKNFESKSTNEDLDLIKKIVEEAQNKVEAIKSERNLSLNESISKGINIGLNDRIGFVKHLFNGSNEDFNRVISQLATIETFEQAHQFINIQIKPDYNKWEGKEEYEMRFLNLIEKKYI